MIWLMTASFELAEAPRGLCICGVLATGEIAGGVVMNDGGAAFAELAAVKKHAEIANPATEANLRRDGVCFVFMGITYPESNSAQLYLGMIP
jgi:hypothetical protein